MPTLPGYGTHPLAAAGKASRLITKGFKKAWFMNRKLAKNVLHGGVFKVEDPGNVRSIVQFGVTGLPMAQVVNEMAETPFYSLLDGGSIETSWLIHKIGVMFSHEALADEQYGVLKKAAKQLALSGKTRKEYNCAATLEGAFTTTKGIDPVTAAGVAVCSTSHNFASGASHQATGATTWSNRLASDTALDHEALKSMHILMMKIPSEEGYPADEMGDTLVVGVDLADDALEITGTKQVPYSDENTINLNATDWKVKVVVSKWKTSSTSYFLIDSNHFDGTYWEREAERIEDDTDYNKNINRWYLYFRGNSSIVDPHGIVGTPGA